MFVRCVETQQDFFICFWVFRRVSAKGVEIANTQQIEKIRSRVQRTIDTHRMIAAGDSILVAVSGGPDSMAMLDLLVGLTDVLKIRLGIAHIDHNLRGDEGRADAEFVKSIAAQYRLPFFLERIDADDYRKRHGTSVEEAARRRRYGLLQAIARRRDYDRIAVGHNANDNAESVLLFLLRGSGPGGLGGIRPKVADRIIRPLIRLKRSQIDRYLSHRDLRFVSDRTNIDLRFVRNRIRHRLLPMLQNEFNPAVVAGLNRLAHIVRDEETWLQSLAAERFEVLIESRSAGRIDLAVTGLREMPAALQRRVLRVAIAEVKGNLRRIGYTHVESIRSLCAATDGGGFVDLPGNLRARRERQMLTVIRGEPKADPRAAATGVPPTPRFEYRIDSPQLLPCTLNIEPISRCIRFSLVDPAVVADGRNAGQDAAFFDMNKLVFPLVLRGVRAGDRFSPAGVHGSQKVKKFFIDHKVPRAERTMCPVLVSAGTIVWLVGHRIDAAFAATADSRAVLKVELLLV
ncbi:MAG TPA: tRNA lysidine(34) synthetase TilS [Desulfobacterales bacterium]